MAVSEQTRTSGPAMFDLDKCVHCGLCLNACPTYRELGLEMDSPRGRIYQMVKAAEGELAIGASYVEHLELCLACRGCESACPSGVPYGRMIEAARAEIESRKRRPLHERLFRRFIFGHLLESRFTLGFAGALLFLYEATGLRKLVRASGALKIFGKLGEIEPLAPSAETPFFFRNIGKTFPADGEKRYRVAFLSGCIANVCFARLNEATVRVLRRNGCEVVIPREQTCCGALHLHSGEREDARRLARRNIDAIPAAAFDAIITNAAGCGSTLKEYHELLGDDAGYAVRAHAFSTKVKDISEFLASIELNGKMAAVPLTVTYQDSCHLAHGQKIRVQPRKMLRNVPGLTFVEMPLSDLCCGSAGTYNIVHDEMARSILKKKVDVINGTGAGVVVTANPGCLLQLRAGVAAYGRGQRVAHVVEILDEAYRAVPR